MTAHTASHFLSSCRTGPQAGRRVRACATALALVALVAGCDRNVEPYQPGEEPRAPDLARIFPGPAGNAGGPGGEPAGSAGTTRGAVPPSRAEAGAATAPASETAAAAAQSAPITGEITLAPALADTRPAGGVLFVIARPRGAQGGPPLAVLRIANPVFPLPFSIGPDNVMIPTMQFAGEISLSARLDADGNAMTRSPGDIASATLELEPGAEGVQLELSERS